MSDDETYEFACEFIHETDNAILIKDPETDEQHWIPWSQITSVSRDKNGIHGSVEMSTWIARKKGLYK